jgi:hypothetical protein
VVEVAREVEAMKKMNKDDEEEGGIVVAVAAAVAAAAAAAAAGAAGVEVLALLMMLGLAVAVPSRPLSASKKSSRMQGWRVGAQQKI